MLSILVTLLVILIACGLLYWLVTLLPLPAPFKTIATAVVVLIAIAWILSAVGLLGPPHLIRLN